MRIIQSGETVNVSELDELDAASGRQFQSAVKALLPAGFESIEIDLSRLSFIDCAGLGALIALRNSARKRNAEAKVRLLNPSPRVQRMFEITRADKLFPIKKRIRPVHRPRPSRKEG